MYFIDSARGDILAWDYNSEDVTLSNERSVFSLQLQNLPFNLTGQPDWLSIEIFVLYRNIKNILQALAISWMV